MTTSVENPIVSSSQITKIDDDSKDAPQEFQPEHPPFASWTNMAFIFMAFFSFSLAGSIGSITTFVYVPLGVSLIWLSQISIIVSCLGIPLTLYFASFSDNLTGKWARWGRRKPLILVSVVPLVLSTIMFAFPTSTSFKTLEYNTLFASIISTITPALFGIPFRAWMIESCSSPNEYTTINGALMLASLFGSILGQVVLSGSYQDKFAGAHLVAYMVIVMVPSSFLALCWFVPARQLQKAPEQPPIISSFRQCIRTKEFQTIFWNETLTQMAGGGAGALTLFIAYLFFRLERTSSIQPFYQPTLFAILAGSVIAIFLLTWALNRYGKILAFKTVMLLLVVLGVGSTCTMIDPWYSRLQQITSHVHPQPAERASHPVCIFFCDCIDYERLRGILPINVSSRSNYF